MEPRTARPFQYPLSACMPGAQLARSLSNIATSIVVLGNEVEALQLFDLAHGVLLLPTEQTCQEATSAIMSRQNIPSEGLTSVEDFDGPDVYHEDESDAGPRHLKTPVRIASSSASLDSTIMDVIIAFNRAQIHHLHENFPEARQLYLSAMAHIHTLMLRYGQQAPMELLEVGMRAYNNVGQLLYIDADEENAKVYFEAGLMFARRTPEHSTTHQLEYANILSNWCRMSLLRGDASETVLKRLHEVLRIRTTLLGGGHFDVIATQFNIGLVEYTCGRSIEAIGYFRDYLKVAKGHHSLDFNRLDPVPALVYILLINHEDADDGLSNELVRGLRTLQDKRQEQGAHSPEVASVLNFVGTILFHRRDFEYALVFFREELRLEETLIECRDDISVSVTCNNIGRILQELGRYNEAVRFYERALEKEYGPIVHCGKGRKAAEPIRMPAGWSIDNLSRSSANLFSTAWYNLGLIHDKLGSYADAIRAFHMSLDLRVLMLGKDHPDIACLLYNIGVLQMEQQLLTEASHSFREALRIRHTGSRGQLNDGHIIKTLEKLVSLQKAKGNIVGALESLKEIVSLQESSSEFATEEQSKNLGISLRSIAELHHAAGGLTEALETANEAIDRLRQAPFSDVQVIEQLVSTMLFAGSVYHELCDSTNATAYLEDATNVIEASSSLHPPSPCLDALLELTRILGTQRCAPVA